MSNIYSAGSARNPSDDKWSSAGAFDDGVPSIPAYVPTESELDKVDKWFQRNRHKFSFSSAPALYSAPVGGFVDGYTPSAEAAETVTLQVGVQDVVVRHRVVNSSGKPQNHGGGGKRGNITRLSRPSIKRMKLAIRNLPEGSVKSMLTLTYPETFPCDGLKVKRDLSAMRKWLVRHHVGGVWILEFQKRGAPHLHVFLSGWPAGGIEAVSRAWHRIVGTDDPKHLAWHLGNLSGRPCLEWMRKPHVASLYATKYAAKQEQKDVPEGFTNVGRFWGMFGRLRPAWAFVVGRGSQCGKATRYLVNNFRCSFDDRAMQAHWVHKVFVSSVLWGGAADLGSLMSFVGWTPF